MKENSKINLSTILLIIAAIVICVMGCYINTLLNSNSTDTSELNISAESDSKLENQEVISDESTFNKFMKNYLANWKKQLGYNDGTLYSNVSLYLGENTQIQSVYIDENNDAYISFNSDKSLYSKYGTDYKIDSNVVNIFYALNGQDGVLSDIIFLKTDGTVDIIYGSDIEMNNKLQLKSRDDLKDIINVVQCTIGEKDFGGALEYKFVDINGNIFE